MHNCRRAIRQQQPVAACGLRTVRARAPVCVCTCTWALYRGIPITNVRNYKRKIVQSNRFEFNLRRFFFSVSTSRTSKSVRLYGTDVRWRPWRRGRESVRLFASGIGATGTVRIGGTKARVKIVTYFGLAATRVEFYDLHVCPRSAYIYIYIL